jgi:hypothetical protein
VAVVAAARDIHMEILNALSIGECLLLIAGPPSAAHEVGDRSVWLPIIERVSTPGTRPPRTGAHDLFPGSTSPWRASLFSISETFFVDEKSVDSSSSSSCGALAAMMVSPPLRV